MVEINVSEGPSGVLRPVWWLLMAQGLALTGFGIVVLAFPQLLIYLVALGFVVVGVILMVMAWRLRHLTRTSDWRKWR